MTLPRGVIIALVLGACSGSRDSPRDASARDPPSLDTVLARGESLYFRAEYDSARAVWTAALERAAETGDSAVIARGLTLFGILAWKLGDFPEAHRQGDRALRLKERLGFTRDLARSYNALGLLAWHESRLSDALDWFGKAATAGRTVGDARAVAAATANIPLVQVELGEFAAARRGYVAAREAARALGDPRIEGNVLTNLGQLEIRVGNAGDAIPVLQEARARYRSAGLVAQEQNALGQLGTAYAATGEPRLAMAALDSALAIVRSQGLRQEEASNLEQLASMHGVAGDYRRALALYSEARAINAQLGLELERGTDLRSEAEILATLGDLERARRSAAEGLAIHERVGARAEALADHLLLAELAARLERRAVARAHLAAGHDLAGRIGTRVARVSAALAGARIAERDGDARGVLGTLDASTTDLALGGYGTEWEAAHLRARALQRLGRLEAAAAAGREAVRAVERVRGGLGSGVLRTAYGADKTAVYAGHVGTLIELGRFEEALEVSDAARGRALIEQLSATGGPIAVADRTLGAAREREDLLREIDGLLTTINDHEASLAEQPDSALQTVVTVLHRRLVHARGEYEALHVRAQERESAALLGAAPPSAARIRESLEPDDVLLEYLVDTGRLIVFVVTRAGVRAVERVVAAERLAARVRLARELLGSPRSGPGAAAPVLGALHEDLLQGVAPALAGARRVVIVPHGVLVYLPFAALRDPVTGRYLVESHAIVQLPAASALPALRARAGEQRGLVDRVVAFAPEPEALPASRIEALAVARAVENGRAVVGRRATERAARQALAGVGVVHLAGHGVLNAMNPLFSRIELARGRGGGGGAVGDDDGRLEVHELLGRRVGSTLVFLSGCETGLGGAWATGFAPGEDFATLARAFLYAGAGHVVATVWRVEDAGAAAFAERFYGALGTTSPADALAAAQRAMLGDSRFRAPYYWASYVLSGDGRGGSASQTGGVVSVR